MDTFDIIIETPKKARKNMPWIKNQGHQAKENTSFRQGCFLLISDSTGEDADPLDGLLISELASFRGCRLIAIFARQS